MQFLSFQDDKNIITHIGSNIINIADKMNIFKD